MGVLASIMLIIYAIIIMSMVLDFHLRSLPLQKRIAAMIFAVALVTGNALAMQMLGQTFYGKFYLFLVQIPLYIWFALFSRYKGIKLLFVLLSIIVFAAPPIMCVTAMRTFYQIDMPTSLVIFFICYVLMILLVYKFLKPDFNYMLENCESRRFWLFCLIPILHYVYSYTRTGYNFIQPFAQDGYWIRQIPTIIVFASYILLIRVFRNTRETQQLKNEKNMLYSQMDTAKTQIDALHIAQEQTVIYRHDMRHHLTLLSGLAESGNLQRIKEYLAEAQADIDAITPVRYCENETVNLILATFERKARVAGIALCTELTLPKELGVSETELCSLLSNALENAITAVEKVADEKLRKVYIRGLVTGGKLVLSTENAYVGKLQMEGELPQSESKEAGHGFGMKSMVAIVEKHGGLYSVETGDGVFILQLMIPLAKKTPVVQ